VEIRDAVKAIAARLETEGLTTRVTSPHCALIGNARSYLQTILADPVAAGYLDAVAYHAYDSGNVDGLVNPMRSFANDPLVQASGLPIWQTEWVLQYDKRNEAYIETLRHALDWARFTHTCYAEGRCSLSLASPGVATEYARDQGMFGPGLGPGGLRLKKFGHAMAQYNRFIEPGSKRIEVGVSGAPSLYVTAFRHPASGALAIVMLNNAAAPVDVTATVANLSLPADMRAVRTSATEESTELGRVALTGGTLAVTLPAESVTTYVGPTLADTTPPSVPAGVGATALSDTLVRVSWTASTDDVAVAGYRVFHDGVEIGITSGTTWLDHGLEGATSYSYTVLAFDLAGNESAQSSPANVTTAADTTPPAVPGHVVATPRLSAVTVTWDPSTDSVADHDLSGFRIYRSTTAGGPYNLLVDLGDPFATGHRDGSAANDQACYYVVTSYDDESPPNESVTSAEAGATPYNRLPGGLQADYYDAGMVTQAGAHFLEWFHTHRASRIDPTVDFDWEQVVPPAGVWIKGLYGTTYHWCIFGVRWQGEVLADQAESYTFETRNLDGARLWVDGNLVIDDWAGWFTHTNTAQVALTPGWHAVRLDYYRYHPEAGEDGVIQLWYSSPSVPRRIIPADHLATVSPDAPPEDHILREVISAPLAGSQGQIALQLRDGLEPYLPSSLPAAWSDPEPVLHDSSRPLIFYGVSDWSFPRIAVSKNEAQRTVDIRPRP